MKTTPAFRRPAASAAGRISRLVPVVAIPLLLTLGGTGCGVLDPDAGRVPDDARVLLDGTSSGELELVVSHDFVRRSEAPGSDLVTSDTTFVAPAYEATYPFEDRRRFLVRLGNPDSAEVDVVLRVYFDDELRYERSSDLVEESLEFNFIFR